MAKKADKVKARLPRGFADREPADIRAVEEMTAKIREVYERYGFEPVETPLIEYTDALGKFLPDQDRPNEGVFSFQDDDGKEAESGGDATGKRGEWLSLRYDLTAPLARFVAENYERLPKPYRSYRSGWVFRNEKPGPGRFRQFMQFDADTVGTPGVAADAEMCMMMADVMEALGIARGDYVIRVNNRKVLDGVLEAIGLGGAENAGRRLTVLRAIDKLDRFGPEGVRLLLGEGRWDGGRKGEGDFTKGAGLDEEQSALVLRYVETGEIDDNEGIAELNQIADLARAAGYEEDRIRIDASVVRGLEYYTGPVYEAELLAEIPNEDGVIVRFGSVGGGGRYDGLVSRFMGQPVPATGFSIGVSRLTTALKNLGKLGTAERTGPVVVTVMERERMADYQRMAATLRAGLNGPGKPVVPVEVFMGNPKQFGKQLQYADRRGSPCVVIQGGDERERGEVQIKDLVEGKRLSEEIEDNKTWRESRPAQVSVPESELVATVRRILDAQAAETAKV